MTSINPETNGLSPRDREMMGIEDDEGGIDGEMTRPEFNSGDKVSVERSDGTREDGWEVVKVRDDGRVVVVKTGPEGQLLKKGVRREELVKNNPGHRAAA